MQIRSLASVLLAALFLSACAPNAAPQLSETGQQAAATIVAGTLQVYGTLPPSPVAPTATPDNSKPVLSITADSNCRTGPDSSFEVVTGFTPGTDLDIVGQDTASNYWEVKIPNSDETCWVWGKYATTSGNLANIPESAPEPSVATGGPAQPGALFYEFGCVGNDIEVDLSWSDLADDESGYHVYRSDDLIADLEPNSESFQDKFTAPDGADLQYAVAAYNDNGESARRTQTFSACK